MSNPDGGGAAGPAGPPPGPDSRRQAALARLVASRQLLQTAWVPAAAPRSPNGRGASRKLGAWWRLWRRRAASVPVLGLAVQAVESAWTQSPWRAAGAAMADELGHTAGPWVRRHPVLTVGLAAAAGGAIVTLRPWTWPTVHRHLRLGPRRLGRWLVHQVAQAPISSILAGLLLSTAVAPSRQDEPTP